MHYLDTCICIEFLRGRLRTGYQVMRNSDPTQFALPSIVVAELQFGAEHSSDPVRELRIVEQFVDSFAAAPFDHAAALAYGHLRQELSEQGLLIGDRAMMIAATALAHQATLVTNNIKDFNQVGGLRLETWGEVSL